MNCLNFSLDLTPCINFFDDDIRFCLHPSRKRRELVEKMGSLQREKEILGETVLLQERENPQIQRRFAVTDWMNDVDKLGNDFASFYEKRDRRKSLLGKCFGNRCGDANEVIEMLNKVARLQSDRATLGEDLYFHNRPIPHVIIQYNPALVVGRDGTFSQILEYLNEEGVDRIGVHGMEGIGKTLILHRIKSHFERSEISAYDFIFWVKVSRVINVRKIQDDIARQINLTNLASEDEKSRAEALCTILQKKDCLFLLDDLWPGVDLESIRSFGIPTPNGRNSVKIIFTTRTLELCTDMHAQRRVSVEPLNLAESMELVGKYLEPHRVLSYIDEVVGKCRGLPRLLITVAEAMNSTAEIKGTDDVRLHLKNILDDFDDQTLFLAAPKLDITHDNDSKRWSWITYPSSRSVLLPKLIDVWFLEINAVLEKSKLTTGMTYEVYLIYQLTKFHCGFDDPNIASQIILDDESSPKKRVSLLLLRDPATTNSEIFYPVERGDGWLELALGHFFNDGDGTVRIEVANMIEFQYVTKRKKGLIIDRMEFRRRN